VLAIPRDAVLLISGKPTVFTVKDGRAERRDVVLGSSQGLMVIAEQGLRPGDQLVVRGHRELRDGAPVLVQEMAVSPDGTLPEDPDVVTQTRAISNGNLNPTER
jgi:multidrug efflux pump subunit AcrA (membrane-fusion protein)